VKSRVIVAVNCEEDVETLLATLRYWHNSYLCITRGTLRNCWDIGYLSPDFSLFINLHAHRDKIKWLILMEITMSPKQASLLFTMSEGRHSQHLQLLQWKSRGSILKSLLTSEELW